MSREEQVEKLTAYMANFIGYTAKVLPDDVIAKLDELAEREDGFLPKVIYQTMKKNQKLAKELDRPSCQDTGVQQRFRKVCGFDDCFIVLECWPGGERDGRGQNFPFCFKGVDDCN